MRLIVAALAFATASARVSLRSPTTAMAGLEGSACSEDEYGRYTSIVCKVEEVCGCADTTCELEWCAEYVHNWKKEFGACLLKGCPK